MGFSNACSAMLTVFCIGLLGFVLKKKGWITDEAARVTPRFLTVVALPPFLLRSVTNTFEKEQLLGLVSGCIVPFTSIFLAFLLASIIARLFKVAKGRRNTFAVMFATSNAMNIGLPLALALFGETALPYILLYFFANVTSFWTYGNYMLGKDSQTHNVPLFSKASIKQIFSPPLLGFIAGLLLVIFDVRLPVFFDKTLKYVGDLAVPCGIMYLGMLLQDIKFSDIKFERDMVLVLLGRFLCAPLLVIVVSWIFPIPDTMRNVFIIQSSLPVMMNVVIMSGFYRTDVKYAALLVSASTVIALVTIPLWAVAIGYL